MNKLTIDIGVEENELYNFKENGSVVTECPVCHCKIEFNLSGLKNNQCITPTVGWKHEWDC